MDDFVGKKFNCEGPLKFPFMPRGRRRCLNVYIGSLEDGLLVYLFWNDLTAAEAEIKVNLYLLECGEYGERINLSISRDGVKTNEFTKIIDVIE